MGTAAARRGPIAVVGRGDTVGDALRGVATHGLADPPVLIADSPLPDDLWRRLLSRVSYQRLAGFLRAAVDDGALPVTDDQLEDVAELHLGACGVALELEAQLVEIADLLCAAGIPMVALKGTAVAHLAYPDPALRSYGDNDVLVPSERYDEVVALLSVNGYTRQTLEARPGFERRFAKGVTLRGQDGDELDLHRNLVFGTFGFRIDLGELFRSAVPFELAGRQLFGLGPETRLLHACYHAALGDPVPRYGSVRDVAQMVITGDHDTDRVLSLVRAWESQAVLARAVGLCRDLLGIELDGALAATVGGYVPSRRERRAIASYVGDNRHTAVKAMASLPYLHGFPAKTAFLRAMAFPQEGFAESFGGRSGLGWVRRGLRSLVRGGRR